LEEIKDTLCKIAASMKLGLKMSETDTQALLVEPIIKRAGHDIYHPIIVRRNDRSPNKVQFDIEIFKSKDDIKIVIEVKSIKSEEFNLDENFKILEKSGGKGNLGVRCADYELEDKGYPYEIVFDGGNWKCPSCKLYDPGCEGRLAFYNYPHDGVGQLRASSVRQLLRKRYFEKSELDSLLERIESEKLGFKAVLTNGIRWVFFKEDFIKHPYNEVDIEAATYARADIEKNEDLETIIKNLKA